MVIARVTSLTSSGSLFISVSTPHTGSWSPLEGEAAAVTLVSWQQPARRSSGSVTAAGRHVTVLQDDMRKDEVYAQDEIAREALAMIRSAVMRWGHESDSELRSREGSDARRRRRMNLTLDALMNLIEEEINAISQEERAGRTAYEKLREFFDDGVDLSAVKWTDLPCSIQDMFVNAADTALTWVAGACTASREDGSPGTAGRPSQPFRASF